MAYMYPCTSTTPTARKAHYCDSCGRVIAVGEKYFNDKGECEGEWVTWRSCQHCQRVCSRIWTVDSWISWDEGLDLGEYLREYYADTDLAAQFVAKWADVPVDEIDLDTIKPYEAIGAVRRD